MKRLVVVADDFGYGFQRNLGILDCYLNQSVSVVSILANCKHTDHAVRLAIQHKVALSLHFNLTEGKPLCCGTDVSSLIDDDGMFWGKPQFWGGRGYLYDDIVRELDAQIDWFVEQFGSLPPRVDGHQHVHVHPNMREAFAATLSRRGIKEMRLPIEHPCSKPHHTTPATRVKFHNTVQSESILSADVFDKHGVSYATNFIGLNTMGSAMQIEGLQESLLEIFGSENVVCELMCHPGHPCHPTSDGFVHETFADDFSCSLDREHELDILTSESMTQFYKSQNISLCSSAYFMQH